jgi:hypothetical protein
MSTRRKRPEAAPAPTSESGEKPLELVVRRGALWRFNTLKTKTADLPVTVLWDRRRGDRRSAPAAGPQERRASDRRQKPPFTWEVADFVVVGQPPATEDAPKPPRRKKKR